MLTQLRSRNSLISLSWRLQILYLKIQISISGSLGLLVSQFWLSAIKFFAQMLVIQEQLLPEEKKFQGLMAQFSIRCLEFLWIGTTKLMNQMNSKEFCLLVVEWQLIAINMVILLVLLVFGIFMRIFLV